MKMNYYSNKKGAVDLSLDSITMMILMVCILAASAALILERFQAVDVMTTTDTHNGNDTVTLWQNGTYQALTYSRVPSIILIGNATSDMLAANYTLLSNSTASSVQMHYTDSGGGNMSSWDGWISYYYQTTGYTQAYNSTEDGLGAVADVTTWLGIVVVILIAAFIIEVVRSLGGSSR